MEIKHWFWVVLLICIFGSSTKARADVSYNNTLCCYQNSGVCTNQPWAVDSYQCLPPDHGDVLIQFPVTKPLHGGGGTLITQTDGISQPWKGLCLLSGTPADLPFQCYSVENADATQFSSLGDIWIDYPSSDMTGVQVSTCEPALNGVCPAYTFSRKVQACPTCAISCCLPTPGFSFSPSRAWSMTSEAENVTCPTSFVGLYPEPTPVLSVYNANAVGDTPHIDVTSGAIGQDIILFRKFRNQLIDSGIVIGQVRLGIIARWSPVTPYGKNDSGNWIYQVKVLDAVSNIQSVDILPTPIPGAEPVPALGVYGLALLCLSMAAFGIVMFRTRA